MRQVSCRNFHQLEQHVSIELNYLFLFTFIVGHIFENHARYKLYLKSNQYTFQLTNSGQTIAYSL